MIELRQLLSYLFSSFIFSLVDEHFPFSLIFALKFSLNFKFNLNYFYNEGVFIEFTFEAQLLKKIDFSRIKIYHFTKK